MTTPHRITWAQFKDDCAALAEIIARDGVANIYGIPAGGCLVAQEVLRHSGFGLCSLLDEPVAGCAVVDDLIDSGRTFERHGGAGYALYRKPHSPKRVKTVREIDGWIQLPWERAASPEDAVVRMLEFIGEDPRREGLLDTPKRVCKAWKEMTAGYAMDAGAVLKTTFSDKCDEMVVLKDIDFHSTCEHHMLPFSGIAHVGYIPNERVVGLSKLARVVDVYARRLQIQERMTTQIARAIQEHVKPKGVGVVIQAVHSCMRCRGVGKSNSQMVTSSLLGVMMEKGSARAEFLSMISVR